MTQKFSDDAPGKGVRPENATLKLLQDCLLGMATRRFPSLSRGLSFRRFPWASRVFSRFCLPIGPSRSSLRRGHCCRASLCSGPLSSPSTCFTSRNSTSFGASSVPLPLVSMASDFAFPSIRVFFCSPVFLFFPGPLWSLRSSLFCHFLVGHASARHFLLVLRHLLPSPVFVISLWYLQSFFSALPCGPGVPASLPPGPSSLHPGLTSRSPFAGRNSPASAIPEAGSFSPHFWTPARVLRPFPVNCSSSHDATAQPYRSLYFGNVRSFAAANLHFSPRNISPPWAHAGYSCLRYPWSFRFYSARYL